MNAAMPELSLADIQAVIHQALDQALKPVNEKLEKIHEDIGSLKIRMEVMEAMQHNARCSAWRPPGQGAPR